MTADVRVTASLTAVLMMERHFPNECWQQAKIHSIAKDWYNNRNIAVALGISRRKNNNCIFDKVLLKTWHIREKLLWLALLVFKPELGGLVWNCMPFIRRFWCKDGSADTYVENMGSFFSLRQGQTVKPYVFIFAALSPRTEPSVAWLKLYAADYGSSASPILLSCNQLPWDRSKHGIITQHNFNSGRACHFPLCHFTHSYVGFRRGERGCAISLLGWDSWLHFSRSASFRRLVRAQEAVWLPEWVIYEKQ